MESETTKIEQHVSDLEGNEMDESHSEKCGIERLQGDHNCNGALTRGENGHDTMDVSTGKDIMSNTSEDSASIPFFFTQACDSDEEGDHALRKTEAEEIPSKNCPDSNSGSLPKSEMCNYSDRSSRDGEVSDLEGNEMDESHSEKCGIERLQEVDHNYCNSINGALTHGENGHDTMDVSTGKDIMSSNSEHSTSKAFFFTQACDSDEEGDHALNRKTEVEEILSKNCPDSNDGSLPKSEICNNRSSRDREVHNNNNNALTNEEVVLDGGEIGKPQYKYNLNLCPPTEDMNSELEKVFPSNVIIIDSDTDWDDKPQLSELGQNATDFITGDVNEYRTKISLVNYSDSESDETETSSASSDVSDLDADDDYSDDDFFDEDDDSSYDEDDGNGSGHNTDTATDEKRKKQCERRKAAESSEVNVERARTDGEIFPEELAPIDYLTISPGEDVKLEPLGTITGIVDVLVVIESEETSPALYDDSVLFLENRQPLGLIFETLGTVEKPFYTIRFNSNQDITTKSINIGDKIMYAPKASNLTKFVFLAELRRMRCNDASWEDDNEAPLAEKDYSDDEEERRARKRLWFAAMRQKAKAAGLTLRKWRRQQRALYLAKKREALKLKAENGEKSEPNRSGLLPGHMNRNPFGDKLPTHKAGLKRKKPTSKPSNQSAGKFDNHWKIPLPKAMFGGKPSWQEQPGLMGPIPGAQFTFTPPSFQPFPNLNLPSLPVGGLTGVNITPPGVPRPGIPHQNPFLSMFNSSIPPPPLRNSFPNHSPGVGPPPSPRLFSPFNFPPPSPS